MATACWPYEVYMNFIVGYLYVCTDYSLQYIR